MVLLVPLGLAAALAACSGSGGTARTVPRTTPTTAPSAGATPTPTPTATPTPTPTPATTPSTIPAGTQAVLVLSVPCDALSTSGVRAGVNVQTARTAGRQQSVRGARPSASSSYSPASFSLSEQGGGTAVGTIGAPASNCTSSSAIPTYTVALASAPGTQVFTISTYASSNGAGTPLSTATVVATLPANTATTLHASLSTPVASISVTAAPTTLELGSTAVVNVIVNALDTAGETIVGPGPYKNGSGGSVTIALTDSDSSGNTKLSTASVTQPGTQVTLTYNGGYSVSSAKITGSASGVASSSATIQFVCAGALSTSALYTLGIDFGNSQTPTLVERYPTTASGLNPSPAGTLTISAQGQADINGVTFAVDGNGVTYVAGLVPVNATSFIATYCPGADGSLPAYRLFAPSSLVYAGYYGTNLAVDASHNLYTTSIPYNAFVGQPSPPPPALVEYPAGAGAPGVPGNTATTVSPSRTISGASTEMVTPIGVAIDSTGAEYVGDQAQINVFGPTQSGNAAPQRTIANTAGGLLAAIDVATDAAGNVYVLYDADNQTEIGRTAPYGDLAVAEYAPGAATPSRVISGPATTLGTYFGQSQPTQLPGEADFAALAVAPDGTIFVASIGTGKSPTTGATSGTEIAVFGTSANGNVAPNRTIDVNALAKPANGSVFPGALAAGANDTVYLGDDANSDTTANGIYAFSTSGALTSHIATSTNGLGWVTGLAIDASGDLVAQSVSIGGTTGQTALFVYSTAGGLSGPTKTIPNGTAVPGIAGNRIAVNAAGDVYELIGPSLSATGVEVYEFSLNGTSGTPIGSFTDNQTSFDAQTGIAVDAGGRIYVSSLDENIVNVFAAATNGSNVSPVASYWDYTASTLNVRGVTLGTDGKTLYATSCDTDSVSVYASGASSAARSIVGPSTKLVCPFAVAVDAAGTMYVGDAMGVSTFAAGTSGNVAPIRQITYLQNAVVNGFTLEDIAIAPGPIGPTNASASRSAARASVRAPSAGAGRSSGHAALRRNGGAICILEANARRSFLSKLLPPGHAIRPARFRSPLCR